MPLSPRTLRPSSNWTPKSISGLALWLDASDSQSLYTTDAGAVTAVSAPTEISGCVLWLDGADSSAASMTLNGSLVETWKDKSGSNNNATASGTARPTLTSGVLNGKSVVTFDGTANAMQIAANAAFNSNDLTYFVVFKQAAAANKGVYTKLNANAGTNGFGLAVRSDPQIWLLQKNAGASQVLTSTANPTTQARIYTVTSSSTAAGYLDGLSSATGASTADHSLVQRVMVGSRDSSEYLNGYVAEVIHYNRVLTRSELAQVEAMLAAKWGISGVHRPVSQELTAVSSPLDIGGCAGWWDASRTDKMWSGTSSGSLVANGGAVLRLEDLSGNGKHLIQATSASAPSRQDGAKNGLPVLNFAGTKSLAAGAAGDWNFLHNTQGGTVIAVIKPFDTADPQTFAYGVSTNVGGATNQVGWSSFFDDRPAYPRNNYVSHSVTAGVSGQTVISQEQNNALASVNDFSLFSFTPFAGSSTTAGRAALYVSGASVGGANSSTLAPTAANSTNALTVGIAGGNSIAGLAELIVFSTVLSAADRARVEKYLQQKWATTTVPDPTPPVGAWLDKSGNARHLTQASSAARPSLLTNGISSKPALNFDGTDDTIWRQPGLTSDDLSILIVHQTNFMSGGVTYEFTHSNDTTNSQASNLTGFGNVAGLQVAANGSPTYMCDVTRSFTQVDSQGRSGTAGDITANVPALSTQCVSYSATASAIRKQAWTGGKGMLNTARFNCGGWSAITLGARRNTLSAGGINSPTVFLSGRIAEVIAYSRYITDTERRRLELYLARKWNVTIAGAPTVSNPDAQDWIDRVYGNGGFVDTAQAVAVNMFCNSIDASGIRDRFYRLNLFAGGTSGTTAGLAACLVPLYTGPTSRGIKFGNAIDSNVGPFSAADYSTTNGLIAGLNSGKYIDTGLASNTMPQSVYQAMHLSAWHGNVAYSGADPCLIGAYNSTTDRADIHLSLRATPASDDARLGQTQAVFTTTQLSGDRNPASYIASRTSPTSLRLYRNGSFEGENSVSVTSPGNQYPFFVHRRNFTGAPNGEQTGMSIWAYSIGAGMTPQQVADYYNAMTEFNTAMGRNLLVVPQVANADAQSWINRVYNAGGTVSASTASAVNTFCNAIDAAQIRDRFYRLNLFCGGTSGTNAGLAACLVPLYRGWKVWAGRNLLSTGDNLTTSAWTKGASTASLSTTERPFSYGTYASIASAISGTTAAPYVANTSNNYGYGTVTVSAYIKANGINSARILLSGSSGMTFPGGGSIAYATVNLSTGAVSGVLSGATATATSAGNGWWRFSLTVENGRVGNMSVRIDIGDGNSYTSNGTESILVWGIQSEVAASASDYDPYPLGLAIDANNNFATTDYLETGAGGGLLGNGTSKYLNTGLAVSDITTAASGHFSVYHGQSSGTSVNRYYMGANDAATSNRFYLGTDAFASASVVAQYGSVQSASQSLASQGHGAAGHRIMSRESESALTHYHNGAVVGTNSTGISTSLSTAAITVFALNRNGTVDRWHDSWISSYSIGLGLNSTQAANYRTIMQTFQTALGRNV